MKRIMSGMAARIAEASMRWGSATLVSMATLVLMGVLTPGDMHAAGDPDKGKQLHDRRCVACHVERFGGDGASVYLRRDRMIHDIGALQRRVALCASQTDAGWFPEDEENVTAYLARRYYKFR
jgi:cytochrome c